MELKITHLAGSDVSKTNGKLAGTTHELSVRAVRAHYIVVCYK